MLTFKSPAVYVNEPGAIAKAGTLAAELGRKAYIIGGATALKRIGAPLEASLKEAGIQAVVEINQGEVSLANINRHAEKVAEAAPDFLIGAGGGLVLDLVKAVGDRTGLPVVAIPTVPATCAAWSALSILHDDEGNSAGPLFLKTSPRLVVADSDVLAEAPRRYFASGVGDTLAKWYEVALNLQDGQGNADILLSLHPAKLALEAIERSGIEAYSDAGSGRASEAFKEVTDAIIVLTGLAGTVSGTGRRALVAHAIHDSLTNLPDAHGALHGEKVGFCLIVQSILEGRDDVSSIIAVLRKYELPVTLAELGITGQTDDKIRRVSEDTLIIQPDGGFAFPADSASLAEAIRAADRAGREALSLPAATERLPFPFYYPY